MVEERVDVGALLGDAEARAASSRAGTPFRDLPVAVDAPALEERHHADVVGDEQLLELLERQDLRLEIDRVAAERVGDLGLAALGRGAFGCHSTSGKRSP